MIYLQVLHFIPAIVLPTTITICRCLLYYDISIKYVNNDTFEKYIRISELLSTDENIETNGLVSNRIRCFGMYSLKSQTL